MYEPTHSTPTASVSSRETVPFVSYPYEWPFGMLKDAALLQLDVALAALADGKVLKGATPYNVQWFGTTPRFIDAGSLTPYESGEPWAGYRQFCRQFLYPLFLQAYRDVPFHPWLRGRLAGVEAEHCRALLSLRDYLRPGVLMHVVLPARAESRNPSSNGRVTVRSNAQNGSGAAASTSHLHRLRRLVERLEWRAERTTRSENADERYDDQDELRRKSNFVRRVLAPRRWTLVWDIGCSAGTYSRLAAEHAEHVLALDTDHLSVDRLYGALKSEGNEKILPLVADVADPSPGLGWRGLERHPLTERGAPDLILCLGLLHYLVIARRIPMTEVVRWLAGFGADIVVEFVGPDDPTVTKLLGHRTGKELGYSAEALELALARHFATTTHEAIGSGACTLYSAQSPNGGA